MNKLVKKVGGAWRHLKQGTIVSRLIKGPKSLPQHLRVHWEGARSIPDAAQGMAYTAMLAADKEAGVIVVIGDCAELRRALQSRLQSKNAEHCIFKAGEIQQVVALRAKQSIAMVLVAETETRALTQLVGQFVVDQHLCNIPLEYAAGLDSRQQTFQRHDEYKQTFFVAPALVDEIDPYALYQESLRYFEQKCGLRDFLDVYQLLRYINKQQIPGIVCEFGSYQGHSGWLIARTLQALGDDRPVYLFDMFESFPEENFGVDGFWSGTHEVSFADVVAKFKQFENVNFVQGDFTETVAQISDQDVAFAYIDCDAYRSTKSLINSLWDQQLPAGAVMAFEDYGHPALLGNRVAVHQEFRNVDRGAFELFSQFSGLYIAVKTQAGRGAALAKE